MKILAHFHFLMSKFVFENNKFVTSVYGNESFSGVIINCESFIPIYQKRRLNFIGVLTLGIQGILHKSLVTENI